MAGLGITQRTYRLTMEIPEGNDEFWEQLAEMKTVQARAELAHEIESVLSCSGIYDVKIKMKATKIVRR